MQLDHDIATLADSDTYSRDQIIERLGDRLTDDDRTSFTSADPHQVARMLGAAGITAATTVAVLHADGCAVDDIASLMPTLGVPMPSAIKVLNQRWDVPMVEAARMMSPPVPRCVKPDATPLRSSPTAPSPSSHALVATLTCGNSPPERWPRPDILQRPSSPT